MKERSTFLGLRRPLFFVTLVVVLGAAALWWRVGRGPRSISGGAAENDSVARIEDPESYVAARKGKEDPATVKELVEAYGKWAPREDTIEARRQVLKALLAQPSVKVAVESVLNAVEQDQTPRAMDPLFPEVARGLASLWDAVTFNFGRDRMYLETRQKPRDVLLASMAEVAQSGNARLGLEQRTMVVNDLIDLYPSLKPDQKPEVDRALHTLAGADIVEILNGRGGKDLKIVSQQQQAIDRILQGNKKQ